MSEHQVFISHNRADDDAAEGIASRLSQAGLRVWIDTISIPCGADWASEIEKGVRESDIFVALLGPNFLSVDFGMYELGFAASEQRSRGGTLLPVILPGTNDQEIPAWLGRLQVIDARSAGTEDVVARIMDRIANARDTNTAADETGLPA
jgi:hypothetical protein